MSRGERSADLSSQTTMEMISDKAATGGAMFAHSNRSDRPKKSLSGKTAFITGATGVLGSEVVKELGRRGARLILQYHTHVRKACELELSLRMLGVDATMIQADFSQHADVKELIQNVRLQADQIDFFIHTAGVCRLSADASDISVEEQERINQINQLAPIEITLGLEDKLTPGSVILYVGSPLEDAFFETSILYGESKKGLHHFAAQYADGTKTRGTSSIYYIPGIMRNSTPHLFYGQYSRDEMVQLGQRTFLEPTNVARNIVSSLISRPLADIDDEYDGSLLVRRDGYSRQHFSAC